MVGHMIRHENPCIKIMAGKIDSKRKQGRPTLTYMQ